jgi:hypothetical protein
VGVEELRLRRLHRDALLIGRRGVIGTLAVCRLCFACDRCVVTVVAIIVIAAACSAEYECARQ